MYIRLWKAGENGAAAKKFILFVLASTLVWLVCMLTIVCLFILVWPYSSRYMAKTIWTIIVLALVFIPPFLILGLPIIVDSFKLYRAIKENSQFEIIILPRDRRYDARENWQVVLEDSDGFIVTNDTQAYQLWSIAYNAYSTQRILHIINKIQSGKLK